MHSYLDGDFKEPKTDTLGISTLYCTFGRKPSNIYYLEYYKFICAFGCRWRYVINHNWTKRLAGVFLELFGSYICHSLFATSEHVVTACLIHNREFYGVCERCGAWTAICLADRYGRDGLCSSMYFFSIKHSFYLSHAFSPFHCCRSSPANFSHFMSTCAPVSATFHCSGLEMVDHAFAMCIGTVPCSLYQGCK